jgi:hypothetical protein
MTTSDGLRLLAEVPLHPSGGGNFSVPHGLSSVPKLVIIRQTSAGFMWFQSPHVDAENVHLVAADGDVTGVLEVLG